MSKLHTVWLASTYPIMKKGRGRIWVSTFEITIIGLLSSAEVIEEMKDAENKQQLSATAAV